MPKFIRLVIWIVAFFFCLWVWIEFFGLVMPADASEVTGKLAGYVNEYRLENKLPLVVEHPLPCLLAEIRLTQIKTDYSHNGFYTLTALPEMRNTGTWYENLAKTGTAIVGDAGVMAAWVASAWHNRNLLAPAMAYGCIKQSGRYTVFIGWKPPLTIY